MTSRKTPLAVALAGLLAWALFLAVLTDRAELLIAAVPLVVAFLAARPPAHTPRFALRQEVSAERLAEGGRLAATVTLNAADALPMIEILAALPTQLQPAAGHVRVVLDAAAGGERSWAYEVICPARGRFSLGRFHVRLWERCGLRVAEGEIVQPQPVHVYPFAAALRHVPRPLHTQASFGNYVAPALGDGIEPGEIQPFVPGDRIRHINWRASLRRGPLYVTRFQEERNADVVLMLDAFADAGAHPHSVLDYGVRAAAALAAAYIGRKDRVGLVELSGMLRWVGPAAGRRHNEVLAEALLPAAAYASFVVPRIDYLPPRVLPPRALVIAISALIDERFVNAVLDVAGRGFDVIVLAVCPVEPTRRALEPSPLDDLALRLWALAWRTRLDGLRRRGLVIVEWHPEASLEAAFAPLAHGRPRPAGRR